jgi:hypothetical protein
VVDGEALGTVDRGQYVAEVSGVEVVGWERVLTVIVADRDCRVRVDSGDDTDGAVAYAEASLVAGS